MAVHSTRRIIREAVHLALPGDGTAAPWGPVAAVDFKFMVDSNEWDPERSPSTNAAGSLPAVYILREVQGAPAPQGHLGRASAIGQGIFRYSIFVQAGAGPRWHDDLDEEIRDQLEASSDAEGAYVKFVSELVVDSIRGGDGGFYEIAYEVPAHVTGDF